MADSCGGHAVVAARRTRVPTFTVVTSTEDSAHRPNGDAASASTRPDERSPASPTVAGDGAGRAGDWAGPPPPHLALQTRPEALLLDFGGVVFQTAKRSAGWAEVAERVADELARAGHRIPVVDLEAMLRGGHTALKHWKNAQSRRLEPTELTHREIWRDFYASPLPRAAREVLVGSAGTLQAFLTTTLTEHVVRSGIPELLSLADSLGVRLGIVSNAHSGRAHRAVLDRHGLADAFGVQVYSDEVGIRKPHPGMITLAAHALGTTAARSWYVGDTLDRDVVAGRRAGVAAVMLTRHHHTDNPPFSVTDRADATFDTPEGLVPLLAASAPPRTGAAVVAEPDATDRDPMLPSAILLDHGGVIAVSVPDVEARAAFARLLADRLTRAGWAISGQDAAQVLSTARARHKVWKSTNETGKQPGSGAEVPEVDAATFWVQLAAPRLLELLAAGGHAGDGVLAWLRAEAHALMTAYARAKSRPTVRSGIRELLEAARIHGVPVGVVSNTVNGRAVREELAEAGIEHLIGAHVYSDELGRRKPDPQLPLAALRALAADPARAVLVGDKPHRDVAAARAAGIGTAVLVRGGSTSDADIDELLGAADPAGGLLRPDHTIAEIGDLIELIFGEARGLAIEQRPTDRSAPADPVEPTHRR